MIDQMFTNFWYYLKINQKQFKLFPNDLLIKMNSFFKFVKISNEVIRSNFQSK